MRCQVIDPANPYVWIFLSCFFLGTAIAQSTLPVNANGNRRKGLERKWAWVYIFASLTIVLGVIGLFISGWNAFRTKKMIWYGLSVTGVSGVAFRFKKSVGVPVVFLLIIFVVYFGFMTYPFRCINSDGSVGWFRVLVNEGETTKVEAFNTSDNVMMEVSGPTLTPVVTTLSIDEPYIMYGGKTLMLFNGMFSNAEAYEARQKKDLFFLESLGGSPAGMKRFAKRLPGINALVHTVQPFKPIKFQRYTVFFEKIDNRLVLRVRPSL